MDVELSSTQKRVLILLHVTHPIARQLSGNKMVAICSGARALVRKGLARRLAGSHYCLTPDAVELALKVRNEARVAAGHSPIQAQAGKEGEG